MTRRLQVLQVLLYFLLCACCTGLAPAEDVWEKRFVQPPAEARILKIIHNWPDQSDAQDQLISSLRTQGFGGVVCNVSFDQYLESQPSGWRSPAP